GKALGVAGEPGVNGGYPELSPDGRRVAVRRGAINADIWLIDLVRGGLTRFTSDSANNYPYVWSPDGTRIAFSSDRTGGVNLDGKRVRGAGARELLQKSP